MGLQAWGSVGGIRETRLGNARLLRSDSFFDIFADFSDIGAPMQRVRIFDGDAMVFEGVFPNGHAATVNQLSGLPLRPNGCGKFGPILPCYWIDWEQRVRFNVGLPLQPVEGTRIALLAEGAPNPIDYLDVFDIKGGGLAGGNFSILSAGPADNGARCIGDYNMDGGIDGADVQAFFNDWENGRAEADVNNDGGVDGSDVQVFFAAWEAGTC